MLQVPFNGQCCIINWKKISYKLSFLSLTPWMPGTVTPETTAKEWLIWRPESDQKWDFLPRILKPCIGPVFYMTSEKLEHPIIGAQIVEPVKYLAAVSPIIRAHHEKFDGTGYPYGLEGNDIPLGSRILAVVDAYTAIRDERIYSKAHTHEEAIAELRRASGTQFDPVVVDVFCKTITE